MHNKWQGGNVVVSFQGEAGLEKVGPLKRGSAEFTELLGDLKKTGTRYKTARPGGRPGSHRGRHR